jgi:hypothetical protein
MRGFAMRHFKKPTLRRTKSSSYRCGNEHRFHGLRANRNCYCNGIMTVKDGANRKYRSMQVRGKTICMRGPLRVSSRGPIGCFCDNTDKKNKKYERRYMHAMKLWKQKVSKEHAKRASFMRQ